MVKTVLRFSNFTNPTVANETVFVGTDWGILIAGDAETGEIL